MLIYLISVYSPLYIRKLFAGFNRRRYLQSIRTGVFLIHFTNNKVKIEFVDRLQGLQGPDYPKAR